MRGPRLLLFFLALLSALPVWSQPSGRIERRIETPSEEVRKLREQINSGRPLGPDFRNKLSAAGLRFGLGPPEPLQAAPRIQRSIDAAVSPAKKVHLKPPPLESTVPTLHVLEAMESNLSSKYRLVSPEGTAIFYGDDQAELAEKLKETLKEQNGILFVEVRSGSAERADALIHSLRIQQHRIDAQTSITVLPHFSEDPETRDNLFSKGIKLDRVGDPLPIVWGTNAGQIEATASFKIQVFQEVRPVTIGVIATTRERIREFFQILWARLGPSGWNPNTSLAMELAEVQRELRKRHPLSLRERRFDFKKQFGTIQLGRLQRGAVFSWS